VNWVFSRSIPPGYPRDSQLHAMSARVRVSIEARLRGTELAAQDFGL
jgi:hypothetical protein